MVHVYAGVIQGENLAPYLRYKSYEILKEKGWKSFTVSVNILILLP